MTVCTQLSDRMPDVALGRARWTADDERHLAACDDCRAEWAIVSAASRLGTSLPAVDPARVTARVEARLGEEDEGARVRTRIHARRALAAGLAAAAVVAFAMWAGRGGRGASPGERTSPMPVPVAATPSGAAQGADSQRSATEPRLANRPAAGAPAELSLPELDSLPEEVLDSMLQALDEPLAQVGAYDLPPDESGDRELEQALAGLEG